mmetsp:Transcript_64751/g.186108  ORF Transcript_64751/g.186108 Transcript_64751/m.186108 type:complete len:156 (+) Transcript_64751:71-538(+)|eukprot:CAMPEP_0177204920 /NCGR_PEP_ID=MMETSP0367-20130122/28595_1 /TAXON_ID=447022 ORGANISM="Scrippsiella hangoei-like, Strain SHHI-4" /NCGR_SAMPLE_ID=MMETSP0367 /ASSEMBLY_ACC=CAM_ASM_000362 /LENGTH=155 /DNA_ID=CAMNT_0018653629 /DNA_START=69 /DNA_END=536 /DNA_ORIENTATION=-
MSPALEQEAKKPGRASSPAPPKLASGRAARNENTAAINTKEKLAPAEKIAKDEKPIDQNTPLLGKDAIDALACRFPSVGIKLFGIVLFVLLLGLAVIFCAHTPTGATFTADARVAILAVQPKTWMVATVGSVLCAAAGAVALRLKARQAKQDKVV